MSVAVSFPSWDLRGLGGELLVVQPFDAPRPPQHEVLPLMFVLGYLDRWLCEPDARRILVEIHATLFGGMSLAEWAYDEVALALMPSLVRVFEQRDLVVLMRKRNSEAAPERPVGARAPSSRKRGAPPQVGEESIPSSTEHLARPFDRPYPAPPDPDAQTVDSTGGPAPTEKTWIIIKVTDEYNNPAAGLPYIMKLPDRSERRGFLDGDGAVRLFDIDPGSCEIVFPTFDARKWWSSRSGSGSGGA